MGRPGTKGTAGRGSSQGVQYRRHTIAEQEAGSIRAGLTELLEIPEVAHHSAPFSEALDAKGQDPIRARARLDVSGGDA